MAMQFSMNLRSYLIIACPLLVIGAILLPADKILQFLNGHFVWVSHPQRVEVAQGDTVKFDVEIESLCMATTINVIGARLPCSCIELSPMPFKLSPMGQQTVSVQFDATDQPVRDVEAQISLFLDVEAPPVVIPLAFRIVAKTP